MPPREKELSAKKIEAKIENPTSLIEDRNDLLDRIEQSLQELPRDEVLKIASRVFEHSVEDGLKLTERLRMTPKEILDTISTFHFITKHEILSTFLFQEVINNVREGDAREYFFDNSGQSFSEKSIILEKGEKLEPYWDQEQKEASKSELVKDVDAFYSQFLKTREFKPVEEKDPRTKGERMAETVLQKVERAGEQTYYVGSVRSILGQYLHDQHQEGKILTLDRVLPNANFMTVEDLEQVCKSLKIEPKQVEEKLKAAKYTLPGSFSVERAATKQELSRELNADLKPRGLKVALDEKENKYEVKEIEDKEEQEKDPDIEALEKFDQRMVDFALKLLAKGADKGSIAEGLAGIDSPQAWELREKLLADGVRLWHIMLGLSGVDSPQAWDLREKLLGASGEEHWVAVSLAGLDSPQAWELRNRILLKVGKIINNWLALSLAGIDTPESWEFRKKLIDKDASKDCVAVSLTGLDSPQSWELRKQLLVGATWICRDSIARSLAGLDSPQAWELRNKFMADGVDLYEIMRSLTGVDSSQAWALRDRVSDNSFNEQILSGSLSGIDSRRAWELREKLLDQGIKDDYAAYVSGDSTTFVWRLKHPGYIKKKQLAEKEKMRTEKRPEYEIITDHETVQRETTQGFVGLEWLESIGLEFAGHRLKRVKQGDAYFIKDEKGTQYGPAFIDNLYDISDFKVMKDGRLKLIGHDPNGTKMLVYVHPPEQKKSPVEKTPKYEVKTNEKLGYVNDNFGWSFDNGKMYFMKEVGGKMTLFDESESCVFNVEDVDWYLLGTLNEMGGDLYIGVRTTDQKEYYVNSAGMKIASEEFRKKERKHIDRRKVSAGIIFQDKFLHYQKDAGGGSYLIDDDGTQYGPYWAGGISGYLIRQDGVLVISGYEDRLINAAVAYVYPPEKGEEITDEDQNKLDLLNLVHNPKTTEEIEEYFKEKSKLKDERALGPKEALKKVASRSRAVAVGLSDVIKTLPELFVDTITAKKDRMESLLARKLAEKMFPGQFKKKDKDWRGWGGYGGLEKGSEPIEAGSPEDYLDASMGESYEIIGGGAEAMSDDREIMSFRDEIHDLVVTGLYGQHSGGRWNKSFFSVVPEVSGLAKETTATLPSVRGGSEVMLPKPLNAKIIRSRVKGIDKKGKEISLEMTVNSLGEAKAVVPKGVEQVVYSLEVDPATLPMKNISGDEYAKFKKQFGREMSQEIARLPEELELFVASITKLPPKQQVIAIEKFVRQVGFYDFDNGEVNALKRGKSIEEQMYIMQERLEELRSRKPKLAEELKGKQYAGVCADFALLSAALLRRAGFASGMAAGFVPEGKTVRVRNAHSVAFAVWPDELGNNRVVTVDGTPGGSDARLAGITLPGISEREEMQAEEIDKMSEEMEKQFKAILDTIESGNTNAIRQLQNGKLEQVLNAVLRFKVKQSHLEALKGMLEYYWYTPAGGMDLKNPDDKLAVLRMMENGVRQIKEGQGDAASDRPLRQAQDRPAGKELLEMMEDYAGKFVKGGKAKNFEEAYKKLDGLVELVKNSLNDTELKAAVAVIHYLRAIKMKA